MRPLTSAARHNDMRLTPIALAALLTAACTPTTDAGGAATPPPNAAAAPTPAGTGPEPHTEAAVRAAATEEFDSYASGDYGAAWDLYYAPAKKAISRADYLRSHELCPDAAGGVRFQIEKVTMDSDGRAHVRVSRLVAVLSYEFVYESGRWRFVPDAQAMSDYRTKTVERMVKDLRAKGGCGG